MKKNNNSSELFKNITTGRRTFLKNTSLLGLGGVAATSCAQETKSKNPAGDPPGSGTSC